MGLTYLLQEAAESKQYHNVISLHAALVRMALRDRIVSTPVYTACPLIPVSQPEVQRRYVTSLLPVQPVLTGANACYIPPQNLKWTHTDSVTVKLVVHINDPTNSTISEFAAWVQAHPKSIGRLGIDSVRFGPLIPGGSAYLVVDMAVALWDCLESHPAITFLGFNDDLAATAANATAVAIRAANEFHMTPGEQTSPDGSATASADSAPPSYASVLPQGLWSPTMLHQSAIPPPPAPAQSDILHFGSSAVPSQAQESPTATQTASAPTYHPPQSARSHQNPQLGEQWMRTAAGGSTQPGLFVLGDTTNRDLNRYRGRGGYRGGGSGGNGFKRNG